MSDFSVKRIISDNLSATAPKSKGVKRARSSSETPDSSPRKRRVRTVYSKQQLQELESIFARLQYPDMMFREQIATKLGLTETQIHNWFQNRRAKQRKLNGHPNPFVPQYHLKDLPKTGIDVRAQELEYTTASAPVISSSVPVISHNQFPLTSSSSSMTTTVPWLFPMSGGIAPYYSPLGYSLAAHLPTSTLPSRTTPSPLLGTVQPGYQYTNPASTLLELTPPDTSTTTFPIQQDSQ